MSKPLFRVRNLDQVAAKDPQLRETLDDIITAIGDHATQTNASPGSSTAAPLSPSSLKVMGGAGIFDAKIVDKRPAYKGQEYFLEHSDDPGFSNPTVIHIGATRNWRGSLGNVSRYWRAYSSYPTSPSSPPVFHGGAAPIAVSGAGTTEPPIQTSQGSGTDGRGGFGMNPYRGASPPVRK